MSEIKSCYDCHNLRCKVPLALTNRRKIKTGADVLPARIQFRRAVATCRCGHLIKYNGQPRIFKNVMREPVTMLQAYNYAQTCPDYDLDD